MSISYSNSFPGTFVDINAFRTSSDKWKSKGNPVGLAFNGRDFKSKILPNGGFVYRLGHLVFDQRRTVRLC